MKPFLKWAGGKRWLTEHESLVSLTSYRNYIEPFLGGGAVFFHLKPDTAILSDLNTHLIEAYIAIRENPVAVQDRLREHHARHCKEYYYETRDLELDCPNDRAAKFLYLNRTCWNGLYRENLAGKFNVPIGTKSLVYDPEEDFASISRLLQGSDIACCDFEATIEQASDGDLGRVDKRDSQTRVVLIQDCFLRSSHGSRGFVGRGVGTDRAATAA